MCPRGLTYKELMLIATGGVEFSFNSQMYKQLDGVAMGSPSGLALANIFVGFHESRLFDNTVKPGVYFRFDHIKRKLNLLHPALKFYSREGAKQLLELSTCFGREREHWISY